MPELIFSGRNARDVGDADGAFAVGFERVFLIEYSWGMF